MAKLTLSAPWVVYYRELDALFKKDPGVHVLFDDDKPEIKICVDDEDKAAALNELLAGKVEYGNVTLTVTVVPANGESAPFVDEGTTVADLLIAAFDGNEAVSFTHKSAGPVAIGFTFIVFRKEVVQYFTDDIGDIYGFHSALYEQLAEKIFPSHENVFFCTDTEVPAALEAVERKWP